MSGVGTPPLQATPPPTSQTDTCSFCGKSQPHIHYVLCFDGRQEHIDAATAVGISVDAKSLSELEDALGELEQLHDIDNTTRGLRGEMTRACLCSAAAAWRRARQVTDSLRAGLGLRARLL